MIQRWYNEGLTTLNVQAGNITCEGLSGYLPEALSCIFTLLASHKMGWDVVLKTISSFNLVCFALQVGMLWATELYHVRLFADMSLVQQLQRVKLFSLAKASNQKEQ